MIPLKEGHMLLGQALANHNNCFQNKTALLSEGSTDNGKWVSDSIQSSENFNKKP